MPGGAIRCPLSRTIAYEYKGFIPCRSYSTTARGATLIGDALGPVRQDAHRSFRLRKDGKPLPLPPLLDPVVLKERSRWEQTKKQPKVEDFTPFQKKLWENPYAHALATPVRACRATFIFVPSFFLIQLNARPHPETNEPWLLPVSLTTSDKRLGPPFRFLGSQLVATELHRKRNWQGGIYPRFREKLGSAKADKIIWREDMADLILGLLRKNLLERLRWFFGHTGQLTVCESPRPEDIEGIEDVSCVLYLGTLKTRAEEFQAHANTIVGNVHKIATHHSEVDRKLLDPHLRGPGPHHHPPTWWRGPVVPVLHPRIRFPQLEFKTTDWRGQKVPVYSLWDLLGEAKMKELVQGSKYAGVRCAVLKRSRHSVPLRLLLMQIQAYVALPGP